MGKEEEEREEHLMRRQPSLSAQSQKATETAGCSNNPAIHNAQTIAVVTVTMA
jgi:hypothetical protein